MYVSKLELHSKRAHPRISRGGSFWVVRAGREKVETFLVIFVIFIFSENQQAFPSVCHFYPLLFLSSPKISKFSPLCLPSPVCSLKYRSNWFPIVFIKDVAEITAKFWWALDLFAYTLCTAQGLRTLALFSSDPVSELAQIVQNVS